MHDSLKTQPRTPAVYRGNDAFGDRARRVALNDPMARLEEGFKR